MVNGYEFAARQAKAKVLADALIAGSGGDALALDLSTVVPQSARDELAAAVGVNSPSRSTWSMVLDMLRAAQTVARTPDPVDPFVGLV